MKNQFVTLLTGLCLLNNTLFAFTVENGATKQIRAQCAYINNLSSSTPIQPTKRAVIRCVDAGGNRIGSLAVKSRDAERDAVDLGNYSVEELASDALIFKVVETTRAAAKGAGAVTKLTIVSPKSKKSSSTKQKVEELPTLAALGGATAMELKVAGAGIVA